MLWIIDVANHSSCLEAHPWTASAYHVQIGWAVAARSWPIVFFSGLESYGVGCHLAAFELHYLHGVCSWSRIVTDCLIVQKLHREGFIIFLAYLDWCLGFQELLAGRIVCRARLSREIVTLLFLLMYDSVVFYTDSYRPNPMVGPFFALRFI